MLMYSVGIGKTSHPHLLIVRPAARLGIQGQAAGWGGAGKNGEIHSIMGALD